METRSDSRYDQIQAGWDVYGTDDEKIGSIEEVGQSYLLVVKGLIFTTDLYIPLSAVRELDTDEGRVHLNVAKDEVETRGWTEPPTDAEMSGETYAESSSATAVGGYDAAATTDDVAWDRSEETTDTDRLRVPVHEETLRAERTAEQAGEVRVGKNVVEEERSIDVPVTRDEVQVRRVSVDREAGASEDAFTDGDTIRVPVTAERVNVTKEPRVVEEIEISKRPVTETQRVSDTVRREEVNVDDSTGSYSGSGSSTAGTSRDFGDATSGVRGSNATSGDASSTRRDRGDDGEMGGEAIGSGAGALGGAAIGAAVAGPPGAIVGGVVGAAGGAVAGERAEGGDEEGGSGAGGAAGALGGAAIGGAVAGPPGAVVGGAVGAGAGSGVGDQTEEESDDDITRR